jgi:CspA family cold shock protein
MRIRRIGPDELTNQEITDAADLLRRLVAGGAALGWVDPPAPDEVRRLLIAVAADPDALLVAATEDGRLRGPRLLAPLRPPHPPPARRCREGRRRPRAPGSRPGGDAVGQTGDMADGGVVREFHADEGWGVVDGPAVPGGCWVHFSAIAMSGFRQLTAGQHVWFRAEPAEQDGFKFRAVKVWTEDSEPVGPPGPQRSSEGAYHSDVVLTFDQPERAAQPGVE